MLTCWFVYPILIQIAGNKYFVIIFKCQVLRRWRHRLHKLGKETTYRCQQIAKLIEIGLQCQEKEPYNRPFIAEIISDIEALDNTSRKISNENESTVGQVSSCPTQNISSSRLVVILRWFLHYCLGSIICFKEYMEVYVNCSSGMSYLEFQMQVHTRNKRSRKLILHYRRGLLHMCFKVDTFFR
jgi:hypothetical protein